MKTELDTKIAEAQKRANKTGLTQYVGERYDCQLYISKVKPSSGWLLATVVPESSLPKLPADGFYQKENS